MRGHVIAMLAYHSIGDPPPEWWSWYYVPEPTFVRHLEVLHEDGWTTIDRAALVSGLADPTTLPPQAAVITFDDGYQSFGSTALPILQTFKAPSILFVPTNHVGTTNRWDVNVEPEASICSWIDLVEWGKAGVSIQSHGASHRTFSELSWSERVDELRESRQAIRQWVHKPVDVVSFPYGDPGTDAGDVRRLLRTEGYRAGCLYGGGVFLAEEADRYLLPRIAMGPETDLRAKLSTPRKRKGA